MQTLSLYMNVSKQYRPWRDVALYVSISFANVLCGGFLDKQQLVYSRRNVQTMKPVQLCTGFIF